MKPFELVRTQLSRDTLRQVRGNTSFQFAGPALNLFDLLLGEELFSCIIGELGNCTPTSDGMMNIPLDELSRGSLLSRDELDVEDTTITGAPNEEIWRRPDDSQ